MKILLTGPCGSVGIQALQELVKSENKYEIVVFERQTPLAIKELELFKDSITIHYGDLRDAQTLDEVVKDIDFVIHTAAIIPPLADHDTKLAYEVNVTGTRNLIEKLLIHSPNAFFLFTSSVSVYGDRLLSDGIKVGDPLTPSVGDYYAVTKIECEEMVVNSGLDYTIFRLSGVMGPRPGEDRNKIEPIMFHMPLETKYELVTTRDCAFALVQAIEKKELLSKKIYNLSGGKECRVIYRDFLKHSFGIAGIDIDKFPKYSFAEQNFHCAFYEDSDVLNDILHFQRDTLQSYYDWVDPKPKPLQRFLVKLFQKKAIDSIASKSDVLQAVNNKDEELIKRFFRTNPILSE
jgi:nucleoside-diphosphate-sugar epimerase